MKRFALLVMGMLLVASISVSAATLSFSQGAAFVSVAHSSFAVAVGTSTQLMWYVDDLGYGLKHEQAPLIETDGSGTDWNRPQEINEVVIQKFLSKSVGVGLGFGTAVITPDSGWVRVQPVVEVNGTIQLLSGKGEKINASLDFGIAQRWIRISNPFIATGTADLNQTVSTLAVTIGL